MKYQIQSFIYISLFWLIWLGAAPPIRAHHTHALCGDRISNGSVICNIGPGKMNVYFQPKQLCTHASVDATLKCHHEVCEPVLTKESEDMIKSFEPHIPVGLLILVDLPTENFLFRKSRRTHTVRAIASYMRSKNMAFVHFLEYTWERSFKNHERRNGLDLIQEMSELVRNDEDYEHLFWHIGLMIELHGNHFAAHYDFEDLSEFVDVFILVPHKHEEVVNGKFYLGSAFPLSSKNHESGSYKYALDFVRPLIRQECLIVQIEMAGKRYVPIDKGVESGPGSLGEHSFSWVPYREICRRNIEERCRTMWDTAANTPFSDCGDDFLSYENVTSIEQKVNLIKTYRVSGLQARKLMDDDYDGKCDAGAVPLLRAMQGIRKPLY